MAVTKKLETLVREFIDEEGGDTTHNFRRYLQLGISAIRELHMDINGAPNFKYIDLNENTQMLDLPNDCLRLLTISQYLGSGKKVPLIVKDNMLLSDTSEQGFVNRGFVDCYGRSFGGHSVRGAAYREDKLSNTLKLSSGLLSTCFYIEYLADIEKLNGNHMVHPYDFEAVKSFIRWANVRSNVNLPQNVRLEFKQQWKEDRDQSKSRINSQTLEEMLTEYRKTYTAAPRL